MSDLHDFFGRLKTLVNEAEQWLVSEATQAATYVESIAKQIEPAITQLLSSEGVKLLEQASAAYLCHTPEEEILADVLLGLKGLLKDAGTLTLQSAATAIMAQAQAKAATDPMANVNQ